MRAVVVLVLAGCSAGAKPPAPAQPSAPQPAAPAARPRTTSQVFCDQLKARVRECSAFANLRETADSCSSWSADMFTAKPLAPQAAAVMQCFVEGSDCEDTLQCFRLQVSDPTEDGKPMRACDDRSHESAFYKVGIPASEWARRRGAGVSTFRAAQSTKQLPIEMCGVRAAHRWLRGLRCDDGSQPITSSASAASMRRGNVGSGGRCGAVIDHYRIPCSEGSYEVFIDSYICSQSN